MRNQSRRESRETPISQALRKRPAILIPRFPMASFWCAMRVPSSAGGPKAVLHCPTLDHRAPGSDRPAHCRPALLHGKSDVEAGLVPAGFSL
jgi:hypothetical protein